MKIKSTGFLFFTVFMGLQEPAVCEQKHLSAIAGEYQGTVKRTEMTLWASPLAGPGEEKALALMFFPTAQRQAQVARLSRLTDALLASRHDRCDLESVFEQLHRPADGPGLVLIHGDWEQLHELEIKRFPEGYYMGNDEYISLRNREYMVKELRRDPDTGKLRDLRLTQTGFIQNFFDNPRLRLAMVDTAPAEVELLADYINAKFAAYAALNRIFESMPQDSVQPCR